MDGSAIYLIGFVALVIFYFGLRAVMSKGFGAVERAMRPEAVRGGDDLVNHVVEFTAPLQPEALVAHLRASVPAASEPPGLRPDLYVLQTDSNTLGFVMGSKIHTVFDCLITSESTPTGCEGLIVFGDWTVNSDSKIVVGIDQMQSLRSKLIEIINEAGGQTRIAPMSGQRLG